MNRFVINDNATAAHFLTRELAFFPNFCYDATFDRKIFLWHMLRYVPY